MVTRVSQIMKTLCNCQTIDNVLSSWIFKIQEMIRAVLMFKSKDYKASCSLIIVNFISLHGHPSSSVDATEGVHADQLSTVAPFSPPHL